MLRLFFEKKEQFEAVVPFRWCVSKGVLDTLRTKNTIEKYLLISITHQDQEIDRLLVPLEQAMEYIQFRHAGKHILHAVIVWGKENPNPTEELDNLFLSRFSSNRYRQYLYDNNNSFSMENLDKLVAENNIGGYVEKIEIEITVGKEFFAKEPRQWEKWWVNLWFDFGPRDQCQFRRRRILAYTIQPFAVLLWIIFLGIVRTIYALVSLLWGIREVKLSPIFHPFTMGTGDVCPEIHRLDDFFDRDNNRFITDEAGNKRSPAFLLLQPLFLITVGTGAFFINHYSVWESAGVVAAIVAAVIAIVVVFILIICKMLDMVKTPAFVERIQKRNARKLAAREAAERELKLKQEEALEYIVCTGAPLEPKLEALPRPRQTVHLKFQNLKAKVCRPFAKN